MAELIRIDPTARQVWQGDHELRLTPLLYSLLTHLVARAGEAVAGEQLLRDIWCIDWKSGSKTLAVHVSLLRKRLGDEVAAPTYITAMRGFGYRFEADMVARTPAPKVEAAEYRLPLRTGRTAPFQTVYDADNVMVAAGMTPQAAAWLVQAANHTFEMEVQ